MVAGKGGFFAVQLRHIHPLVPTVATSSGEDGGTSQGFSAAFKG